MSEMSVYVAIVSISALLAIGAGRAFAIEGKDRIAAILGPAYIGAGVGLMTAVLIGPPLTIVAQYMNETASTWFDALDVAGTALLWGTVAGAGGGLAIGLVVAALPAKWLSQRQSS